MLLKTVEEEDLDIGRPKIKQKVLDSGGNRGRGEVFSLSLSLLLSLPHHTIMMAKPLKKAVVMLLQLILEKIAFPHAEIHILKKKG